MLTVNTNIASINTQNKLNSTQSTLETAMQRLSSGLRINSAKDDAAGLAISNRMNSQIEGLTQAARNANDGISIAQTAEGALDEVTTMLQRMRELAVQAANDSNTAEDRASIQIEIDELVEEIDRIADTTTFNGKNILDGSAGTASFQVGANANETIEVDMVNVKTNALGDQAGITQTTGSRVSLTNDGAETGDIGILADGTSADTVITTGDVTIQIGSGTGAGTAVDITAAEYGGDITAIANSDLVDTTSADYGDGYAKAIAERINSIREMEVTETAAGIDGTYLENVYASAETEVSSGDLVAAADNGGAALSASADLSVGAGSIDNGDLQINGVDIGAVEFEDDDADGSLVTAINAKSDITGVEASINDDGELVLTADDGRDIVITTADTATTNTLFANGETSTTGKYYTAAFTNLRVTGEVTITAMDTITTGGSNTEDAGFATLTEDNVQAVGTIANADVTTVEAANNLINAVDSALEEIDSSRAALGAVQNRFEHTIANLENVSENLSASRSRIVDADFASETASLTKAQTMQQAGIAMLAQANSLPQTVLSLLQ